MISRIDVGMVMALSCTYIYILKNVIERKKNILQNLGDRKSSGHHYIIGILYMRNTKRVIII